MRVATVLVAAAMLLAAGCSDDDDDTQGGTTLTLEPATTAADTTTAPVSTSTPASTTDPPTTVTATTGSPTTQTPTTPPVDEEALKAEIARDYERAYYRSYEIVEAPRLRNLADRASSVAVRGSPAFRRFVAGIRELVALGDAIVPNEPDLLDVTVEDVRLLGEAPYKRAIVTACEVTNRKRVTLPESSPTGEEIVVAGSGQLLVFRFHEPVRLTDNGWLRFREPREGVQFNRGETTCPPQ